MRKWYSEVHRDYYASKLYAQAGIVLNACLKLSRLHWLRSGSNLLLTFRVLHGSAPPFLGPIVPVYAAFPADGRFVLQPPIIFWFYRWSPCFPGCWPKGLERPAGRYNIFPVWNFEYTFRRQLKTWLSVSFFGHCILTFGLGFSVVWDAFCRLRSIRYDMIRYDITVYQKTIRTRGSHLARCSLISSSWR